MELERLKVGQNIAYEQLEEVFSRLNYQKTDFVTEPAQYALRGATVDIYPLTYRAPVRLEFQLDQVASIRDFSPVDGKSMASFEEVFLIPLNDRQKNKISKLRERFASFEALTETKDLERGDYVVHFTYGIGRFLGTKVIQIKGVRKKTLALEYANKEILYVDPDDPVERYIGGEGTAPRLTKLNTKEWERIKEKTRLAVKNVAHDLLELQAKRSFLKGSSFPPDNAWQKEFEAEFPFEETPDQLKAADEVKKDMESRQPMDRLLCGDVGYGKTEVAMRAAFKAVTGGRQAAILVPTTVLAEQHYIVLKRRVKSFPVSIGVLSRFQSRKQQLETVAAVKEGKVDIVVGTHRLLSKDVQFKDLGLVIIDEEQRFGVRHKEKLKQLRHLVDVLSLTATPIPRTLYMSLMGVRDMSVINTPPKNRLPIETYVLQYDERKITMAVEKELARGGQVYFIHNRVQSIEKISENLREIMPHVRFCVAHGQMPPQELETVMQEFMERRADCLISTNIIESGIDIPNVNTIIVNRADQFGLADLYQLRGRVGRFQEKRQAYAYFFVPKNWVLTSDAEKRLAAIERFTDLGSGFKIALEDLEIRGAGNLLGHEQSGFIHAVGFDLYCRMLRKAIEDQKKQK
ncbi:MAG TPA: transcription-repair coupling factor [Verrucomicrobiae bacterium]|jgi:transcription-repair coupling factor (superfamily II helicase)|nr:transcription-repair coupling factor [Verrucomicrobiae bacterium]